MYRTIEALEKKNLVIQTPEGLFKPKASVISDLRDQAEDLAKRYTAYIERLYSQSVGSSTLTSSLKKEILSLLQNMGYIIEDESKIADLFGGKEKMRRFVLETSRLPPSRLGEYHGRMEFYRIRRDDIYKKISHLQGVRERVRSHSRQREKSLSAKYQRELSSTDKEITMMHKQT